MKRLIVLTFGLLMCFSTVSSIQTEACSDLIVSMCPSNPAAYPTYGGWEPAHLGTLTSSKKATKTYVNETNWKTIHTEYLYKTKKKNSKTMYIKYKRTHLRKYRMHYKKNSKDEQNKVILTKNGSSYKKPKSPYKKW
mgnify:FL=1